MIGYTSSTGTRSTLAALRAAGWHLLVSPGNTRSHDFPYAIDNGAWPAYVNGRSWPEQAFSALVDEHGPRSEFIVAPDVVAGGLASLRLSEAWLPKLATHGLTLIPVQDGMEPHDLRPIIDEWVGIFVGGTTEWKIRTMRRWGELARELGAYLHVGRVNTRRRVSMCAEAGADSFDGTGPVRFPSTLGKLEAQRQQLGFGHAEK